MEKPAKQNLILFVVLPFIVAVCCLLWIWADYSTVPVQSQNGVWDLRQADFETNNYTLSGDVEYISGELLTPDEFDAHPGGMQTGPLQDVEENSTIRIEILVPEGIYGLMEYTSEYASRIYLNGQQVESMGALEQEQAGSAPVRDLIFSTVESQDDEIEIVLQTADFVYTENGNHDDIIIGNAEAIRWIYTQQIMFSSIILGCYLALFLAHFALYSFWRAYKANLWFMLFCLTWLVRASITGPVVLPLLIQVSWDTAFRLEYLTLPVAVVLMCLVLRTQFPGLLQKVFRVAAYVTCGIFAALCLVPDMTVLSWIWQCFYFVIFVVGAYIIVRAIMKLRKPDTDQVIFVIGMGIMMFGAFYDILYAKNIRLIPTADRMLSEITMLIFVFFQMTAMFRGTMREVEEAKESMHQSQMEAEALRRLNHAKEEFFGDLSHELKAPITVISGFAQHLRDVAQEHPPDLPELADGAKQIELEADRMERLVEQLLDMAAIDAGYFRLKKSAVAVNELYDRLEYTYFHMRNVNNNQLVLDCQPGLVVTADEERLLQVLVNLISNASRHTSDGTITLSAVRRSEDVLFSVTDTGEGIPPMLMDRLFGRYPHAAYGKTQKQGSGLGLTISKKLVEAHGGKIGIISRENEGTRVWFIIPVEEEMKDEDKEAADPDD